MKIHSQTHPKENTELFKYFSLLKDDNSKLSFLLTGIFMKETKYLKR